MNEARALPRSDAWDRTKGRLEQYFDRTALDAWTAGRLAGQPAGHGADEDVDAACRGWVRALGEAAALMKGSEMLNAAFGAEVIEHYHHAAMWEIEEQNRVVTDWEVRRGFERA